MFFVEHFWWVKKHLVCTIVPESTIAHGAVDESHDCGEEYKICHTAFSRFPHFGIKGFCETSLNPREKFQAHGFSGQGRLSFQSWLYYYYYYFGIQARRRKKRQKAKDLRQLPSSLTASLVQAGDASLLQSTATHTVGNLVILPNQYVELWEEAGVPEKNEAELWRCDARWWVSPVLPLLSRSLS